MILAALTTETGIVVAALIGGSGLLSIAIKRTWSGSDRADEAFERGHDAATERLRAEADKLRAEFKLALDEQDKRHERELAAINEHVARLHLALGELVLLVAPEYLPKATSILVKLGVPTHIASTLEDQ